MTYFIPPASKQVFHGTIIHPDLYLWDAWSYFESDVIHLYCLAVNRTKSAGEPLLEHERNNYPFHVRHFSSSNNGETWLDNGCFQKPGMTQNGHDARNIWSGSIASVDDGKKLVAYTGLYQIDEQRTFLQNISLAVSNDGYQIDRLDPQPLSCPSRDRSEILKMGYYLDEPERLGHKDGESGGPVMSWRDPFIFCDEQHQIHLIWSAKSHPMKGVIGHGLLSKSSDGYRLGKLLPPIVLPDEEKFTQAELPKIYHDKSRNTYYLIVSTCDRIYEGQPDTEVSKVIRLFKSSDLTGEWTSVSQSGSPIIGTKNLFGMTVLKTDFENQRMLCIAPYIATNDPSHSLTFSAVFYLDLSTGGVAT